MKTGWRRRASRVSSEYSIRDNESGTQPFDIPWGFGQEVWGRRSTQGLEFGSELVHGFVVEAASCIAKPNELFAVIGAQDERLHPPRPAFANDADEDGVGAASHLEL